LLKPERDFFFVSAFLEAGATPRSEERQGLTFRLDRLPDRRRLRISIIFGILDPKRRAINFEKLIAYAATHRASLHTFLGEISETYPSDVNNDTGSEIFLDLVEGLVATLDRGTSIEADPELGILRVRGKLRRSGRAVEIALFFGPTDVLTTTAVRHWKPLLSFLEQGDVMIYMGHAGLGENMKMANLMKGLQLNEKEFEERINASPGYQLLAYFSCYSYSNFGIDVVKYRRAAKPDSMTDILYTAMDYAKAGGALGVLNYIDRYLANRPNFRGRLADGTYVKREEYLIVKNFE
jgi:hypothetical protein